MDPHWIDPRRAAVVHGDAVLRPCFFTFSKHGEKKGQDYMVIVCYSYITIIM